MARLAQLLAAAKTARKDANDQVTGAYHLAQKPALFNGVIRTYQPKAEDGVTLPSESQRVQHTVPDLLADFRRAMGRLIDIDGTISHTNQLATGDIVIGDTTLFAGVPVPHLLYLEKQLTDLHSFVSKLPTLDPTAEWVLNEDTGLRETPRVQTHRTQKVTDFKVVVQATDKHPAQVAKDERDEVVGYWSTVRLSGAMPVTAQRKMLTRVSELLQAVKKAREAANTVIVEDLNTSEILGYVFDIDW